MHNKLIIILFILKSLHENVYYFHNIVLKEGVHQCYMFVLKCRVRYTDTAVICDFPQICIYTARQPFRFPGSGSPETQSRFSGNTISVLREHNLGSPGTQSRFSGNTISDLEKHNFGSPGTQSRFSRNTILVLREHNLGSPGTQSWFSGNTIFVL